MGIMATNTIARASRPALLLPALLLALASSGCKRGGGEVRKVWLELCSGFASPTGGMMIGRVHAGAPAAAPQPGADQWTRLNESLAAVEANPIVGADLKITVGERTYNGVRSNDRGYIDLAPLSGFAPPKVHVRLELPDARYQAEALEADLPVYDDQPGLGVISDIDDTLLDSEITDRKKMLRNAALRSTWELRDFPDAARVVSGLAAGRPIFYISGSPWGFRLRISDYFDRRGFPRGTLLLKRFSSDPLLDQEAYKWQHISRVVDSLPSKRWLLLGDSGEKDPEIYASLREKRPGRVEAIYIHLVTDEDPASARFRDMRVFRSWSELDPPALK
jgi:phosphatidate phosphatase APP1